MMGMHGLFFQFHFFLNCGWNEKYTFCPKDSLFETAVHPQWHQDSFVTAAPRNRQCHCILNQRWLINNSPRFLRAYVCVCVCVCVVAFSPMCAHMHECVLLPQVQWSVYIYRLLLLRSRGRKLIWRWWCGPATAERWPSSGGLTTALRWETSLLTYVIVSHSVFLFHPRHYFPFNHASSWCLPCIQKWNVSARDWLTSFLKETSSASWMCLFIALIVFTAAPPLIMHNVKGYTSSVFYIQLRGCTFYTCETGSVFFSPFEIQPIITLEGSISHTFQREGKNKVTVQVASGSTIMQDSKVITVKGE